MIRHPGAAHAAEFGIAKMNGRSHVFDRDEDLTNVPVHTCQASDLVILRLLTNMPRQQPSKEPFPRPSIP